MITWAHGGTLGSGECEGVVMGAWAVTPVPLHQGRTHTPAPSHPLCFPTEFGKEKSIPLNNLTADEVGKALESVVKSHV